jgi:benzoyl-CoA reductase/2-hydroxyglutaryl-CoA dehydratase subunit BcrC/BadD/HgdB
MSAEHAEKKPNRFETPRIITEMVNSQYRKVREAHKNNQLVAWCGGTTPIELMEIMGMACVHLENYAAACAARKVGNEVMEMAESAGYSAELCSYARISIGATMGEYACPVGGLGRPDIVITANNICQTTTKWCETVARRMGVPVFIIDVPFTHGDAIDQRHLEYVKKQLYDLIGVLEIMTGRRYDPDRAQEIMKNVREASRFRREAQEMCRFIPSPMSSFDAFINLAPVNLNRGTPECTEYYFKFKSEVEERAARGIGAVPEERHRIYWDNICIWPALRKMSEFFARHDACLVAASYTHSPFYFNYEEIDPGDPVESMARELLSVWINRSVRYRAGLIAKFVEQYRISGLIMHSGRTCRRLGYGQYTIARMVSERCGVPYVFIEGDHADRRYFSEAQVYSRLEAFLENL